MPATRLFAARGDPIAPMRPPSAPRIATAHRTRHRSGRTRPGEEPRLRHEEPHRIRVLAVDAHPDMDALVRAMAALSDDADGVACGQRRACDERRFDRLDREHRTLIDPDGEHRPIHHGSREGERSAGGRAHRSAGRRGYIDSAVPRRVGRGRRPIRTDDPEGPGNGRRPSRPLARMDRRRRCGRPGGRRGRPGEEQCGDGREQRPCTESEREGHA